MLTESPSCTVTVPLRFMVVGTPAGMGSNTDANAALSEKCNYYLPSTHEKTSMNTLAHAKNFCVYRHVITVRNK